MPLWTHPITESIANTAQTPNIPENVYRLLTDKPELASDTTTGVGDLVTLEDTTGIGGHLTPAIEIPSASFNPFLNAAHSVIDISAPLQFTLVR